MKGVIEIEFIISVFIFITTMSFVTFLIVSSIPAFHNTAVGELVKSRSYQFAEIMFMDEGSPTNWQIQPFADVKRIGFSTGKRYVIDQSKLDQLAALCQPEPAGAGYQSVKNRLGLDSNYDITIEASYLDGAPVTAEAVVCGPLIVSQLRQQFHFTRLGILNTADQKMIRMIFTITR